MTMTLTNNNKKKNKYVCVADENEHKKTNAQHIGVTSASGGIPHLFLRASNECVVGDITRLFARNKAEEVEVEYS